MMSGPEPGVVVAMMRMGFVGYRGSAASAGAPEQDRATAHTPTKIERALRHMHSPPTR